MKKGFVIEQALLHHLQALSELPEEVVVPARLLVDGDCGEQILSRLEAEEGPDEAMKELFAGDD